MTSLKIKLKDVINDNVISFEKSVLSLKKAGRVTLIIEEYENRVKEQGVDKEALLKEYKDVVWIWSSVSGDRLQFGKDSYSIGHSLDSNNNGGKVEQTFYFPELLEGGGLVYAEAFIMGTEPVNSIKAGILVQAMGTPEILGVRWERYNKEGGIEAIGKKTKIPFGVTVILHIYTRGLYGQKLDIKLMDDDGLIGKDDELPPFERTYESKNENVPEKPELESLKVFKRVVKTYYEKQDITPSYAVKDELVRNKKEIIAGKEVLKPEKIFKVQKVEMEIYIDPFWRASQFSGEEEIEIYAKVKHRKEPIYKEFKKEGFLTKTFILESKLSNTGNKAVLIGETEANVADFFHCRYDQIKVSKKGKSSMIIFDSTDPILRKNNPIIIDIIAGKKETYFIDVIKFETDSCEDIILKHNKTNRIEFNKVLPNGYSIEYKGGGSVENKEKKEGWNWVKGSLDFTSEENLMGFSQERKVEVFKYKEKPTTGNIIVRESQIELDAFYDYDLPSTTTSIYTGPYDLFKALMKYFWLPDLKRELRYIRFKLNSCAYERKVEVVIYPDIKWTLKFGFNVTNDDIESLNKRGLKSPLGIFEKLEEEQKKAQEASNQSDKDYMDKNNHLKKILYTKLDETKKKHNLSHGNNRSNNVEASESRGNISGLIKSLSRVQMSLYEEHYGGKEKNELNEMFINYLMNKLSYFELIKSALGMLEGDNQQITINNNTLRTVNELKNRIKRDTVTYDIIYPKFAFAGSWFYEAIDPTEYPLLVGRQGLAIDLNLSARPLVGTVIKWDLLELLARKHPLAYGLLKTIDILMELLTDDESCFKFDFTVTGNINANVNFYRNMLAGNNEVTVKGDSALQAELKLKVNIASKVQIIKYEVLAGVGFGAAASAGLGTNVLIGADQKGMYMQVGLIFEGLVLEFSGMVSAEVKRTKGGRKVKLYGTKKEIDGKVTFLDWNGETDKFYFKS